MKTPCLILALFVAIAANAQRIDYALNSLHQGKSITPIQLTPIEPNKLAVVYVADSFNYITRLNTSGEILNTIRLDHVSENEISYVNFTKSGYDIFYYHTSNFHTIRSLVRLNESSGLVHRQELFNEDSIYNERYFAFGINKFLWFNHGFNNLVSVVVGHISDTGEAKVKRYELQSHYIELNHLLGSQQAQFIAYFNQNRYLLTINDSLNLDTVRLDIANHKIVEFKQQLLRTVEYNKNQWNYTALLSELGDTVFSKSKFNALTNSDWVYPSNNNLWVVNSKFDFDKDSIAITLIDTMFNEVFTKYIGGFRVKDVAAHLGQKELYILATDSNGMVVAKVNENTFNTGVNQINRNTEVSIYPNPVNHSFTISGVRGDVVINIYNSQGQFVRSANAATSIDVSDLPSGLYFYQLSQNENLVKHSGKLVKY